MRKTTTGTMRLADGDTGGEGGAMRLPRRLERLADALELERAERETLVAYWHLVRSVEVLSALPPETGVGGTAARSPAWEVDSDGMVAVSGAVSELVRRLLARAT